MNRHIRTILIAILVVITGISAFVLAISLTSDSLDLNDSNESIVIDINDTFDGNTNESDEGEPDETTTEAADQDKSDEVTTEATTEATDTDKPDELTTEANYSDNTEVIDNQNDASTEE